LYDEAEESRENNLRIVDNPILTQISHFLTTCKPLPLR